MACRLDHSDIAALARGYALLGSGGGGPTTTHERMLRTGSGFPLEISSVDDVDPATPCLAVGFVGATMLFTERLPDIDPFERVIAAAERWFGHRIAAVCSMEGGGMNGLTPLLLAGSRMIVDADCTGRAVPGIDQMSPYVDGLDGLVLAYDTGAGGVGIAQTDRAIDAERMIRAGVIQAGGTGGAVIAGFTVGDLRTHAIIDNLDRALMLGRAFLAATREPLPTLATVMAADLLAKGRIVNVIADAADPQVKAVEIAGSDGAVHRVVCRSEVLAVVSDGMLVASSPTIVAVLDAVSREILEVTDLVPGREIGVLALPAPQWWHGSPHRLRHVQPSFYGIADLDVI